MWITVAGLILSGITGFITARVTLNKDKRDDYEAILKSYREEFNRKALEAARIEKDNDEYEVIVDTLRREVAELKLLGEKHRLLEPAHYTLPIPFWIKDTSGVMLYANDAYINEYLIPNNKHYEDYVGKTDAQFWGIELGEMYLGNDKRIMKKGMSVVNEYVYINGNRIDLVVIKYPITLGKVIIGVAGLALDKSILNT